MPFKPEQLDEHERKVYDSLRNWRARKAREKTEEVYQIAQNRTLVELIRRKRRDPNWASGDERDVYEDLRDCWGIGSYKGRSGHEGFEMIQFMNQNKRIQDLLQQSREESRLKVAQPEETEEGEEENSE